MDIVSTNRIFFYFTNNAWNLILKHIETFSAVKRILYV